MSEPCIIAVAITGSVARKKHNPAVPETVSEQIESTHEAFEAGASLVHVHSRNDDGSPCTDPDKFAEFQAGIKKHCPGIIVQFSTGGRSGTGFERGSMLQHRPEMASLSTGSCNFPQSVYENSNELISELASLMLKYDIKPEIEVFDLAMLYNAASMATQGLLKGPLHVQFVLGVKNALPAHRDILEFELEKLHELLPDATWVAAGIGKSQFEVNRWCLELGGHLRTGLEDNIRLDSNTLAPSNAALVVRAADLCARYDRHPATTTEARAILGLPNS
ncbi:MAG: 3-keto-5-aminohexanoate cleavage protein [Gammaproteobacteria bacterium]|nr:3-keto-5-aminohexanoate cleavage protein [Gammaproteobacteria bacterium]MDH3750262.1 3-keto-5-aminohexanoate cleavage protein [Gammaproteobacteria bacterium]MDH3805772.1 3-keto-5-aminohexanoate cleavage protein [Gammaproteobacteria bacterium]